METPQKNSTIKKDNEILYLDFDLPCRTFVTFMEKKKLKK